jgi:hypothetical protein
VLTILLLYIFGYLFGCSWFGVYNYFQGGYGKCFKSQK